MIHLDSNDWKYYESLEEIKADGLTPIKVWSPLQFFTLRGKTSKLAKENLIPLEVEYVVLTHAEIDRYYLRKYRGYSIDQFYFMRRDLDFSGSDETIDSMHRYIYDDRVWILMTKEMVEETKKMLERVYKANKREGDPCLSYKTFIDLMEKELRLEDYRDYGRPLPGFRTACMLQETAIRDIWKNMVPPKK